MQGLDAAVFGLLDARGWWRLTGFAGWCRGVQTNPGKPELKVNAEAADVWKVKLAKVRFQGFEVGVEGVLRTGQSTASVVAIGLVGCSLLQKCRTEREWCWWALAGGGKGICLQNACNQMNTRPRYREVLDSAMATRRIPLRGQYRRAQAEVARNKKTAAKEALAEAKAAEEAAEGAAEAAAAEAAAAVVAAAAKTLAAEETTKVAKGMAAKAHRKLVLLKVKSHQQVRTGEQGLQRERDWENSVFWRRKMPNSLTESSD